MHYTTSWLTTILLVVACLLMSFSCPARAAAAGGAAAEAPPRPPAHPAGWQVSPIELDLGRLKAGGSAEGTFIIRGIGATPMWSTRGPKGCLQAEQEPLVAPLVEGTAELKVVLDVVPTESEEPGYCQVRLSLQQGDQSIVCVRDLPVGSHREALPIETPAGSMTAFIRYRLVGSELGPLLIVAPLRIDLGKVMVGQQASKLVTVRNAGSGSLKWRIAKAAGSRGSDAPAPAYYIAFGNEAVRGKGSYLPPPALKEVADFSGTWLERDGWPRLEPDAGVLRYRFRGTGVGVLLWKGPGMGTLIAFIDEAYVRAESCSCEEEQEAEVPIAEDLPAGNHLLTLTARDGSVVLEGLEIFGLPLQRVPAPALRILPDSGATVRETDYVNIVADAKLLKPGYYDELLVFDSNGGQEAVAVSFEVVPQPAMHLLDVYRYARGSDYIYTSSPETEGRALLAAGYVKQGIAFRLFNPGTPGTTEFYRWRNSARSDHYYSYDQASARARKGYVLEGTIGNIATSQLTGTRPLYRWFNPRTGTHFYSTDAAAEGKVKHGYRFEGIAGYVK